MPRLMILTPPRLIFFGPALGGAKAPVAPDTFKDFKKCPIVLKKCSPHLTRRKNLDFYFLAQPKETRHREKNKNIPARLDHRILLQVTCEIERTKNNLRIPSVLFFYVKSHGSFSLKKTIFQT